MGWLFKSAEEKAQERAWRQQEVKRKIELEEEREMAPFTPYVEWLNAASTQFQQEISSLGIHPTWGFELQPDRDDYNPGSIASVIDGVVLFDVENMNGIAFDDKKKKAVLYSCKGRLFSDFTSGKANANEIYKFTVIDYSKLLSVKVETNNMVSYESKTKSTNTLGRSVAGGMLAGSAGAIIGGATANQKTDTQITERLKEVEFLLMTSDPDCRIIKFAAKKPYRNHENMTVSNKEIGDAMASTFAPISYVIRARHMERTNGTTIDVLINRCRDLYMSRLDEENNIKCEYWSSGIETVRDRLVNYARLIETIIIENERTAPEEKLASVTTLDKSPIDQLRDLKTMLDEGLITQDEYDAKKTELLRKM